MTFNPHEWIADAIALGVEPLMCRQPNGQWALVTREDVNWKDLERLEGEKFRAVCKTLKEIGRTWEATG